LKLIILYRKENLL